MSASQQIYVGSVISAPKGIFNHVGLVLCNGRVFHNNPTHGEHLSNLANFSKGAPVKVIDQLPMAEIHKTHARIKAMLRSPRSYHPINNNCEQSLHRAMGRPAKSPQLRGWSTLGLVACLTYLVIQK